MYTSKYKSACLFGKKMNNIYSCLISFLLYNSKSSSPINGKFSYIIPLNLFI